MGSNSTQFKKVWRWLAFASLMFMAGIVLQSFIGPVKQQIPQAPINRKTIDAQLRDQGLFEVGKEKIEADSGRVESSVPEGNDAISMVFIDISPEILEIYRKIMTAGEQQKSWQNIGIGFSSSASRQSGKIKLHGWTSLATPKKSYSIKLHEPVRVAPGLPLQRFFLLNMLDDIGGFRGYFSYSFLAELGLFANHFQYVVVHVNGSEEGVYLLLERTRDALLRSYPSIEFIARRRTNDNFEEKYIHPDHTGTISLTKFIETGRMSDGKDKRLAYTKLIDLDQYLTWLVYNALVEYPDSLDELFFYRRDDVEKTGQLLQISAWDYDALFVPPARPENVVVSPLFSGVEGDLGHFIARDELLLNAYRHKMEELLQGVFSAESIRGKLVQTAIEQQRIAEHLSAPKRDVFLQLAGKEMEKFKKKILRRRKNLLTILGRERQ